MAVNAKFTAELGDAGLVPFVGRAFGDAVTCLGLPPSALETIRNVTRTRQAQTALVRQNGSRRLWQLTCSYVAHAHAPALLCIARDVTVEADMHRRLRDARATAGALGTFARASLSFDAHEITEQAARTAATVANYGAALVYLGTGKSALQLAASHGLSRARTATVPGALPADTFQAMRDALASGTIRVVTYTDGIPTDERSLMRRLGMMLLAIVPIRSPFQQFGVLLALYRVARRGAMPEELQTFEACAGQLALSFEHARLFAAVERERAGLALVLDQIPDAVVIADSDGRVTRANPAATRLLGAATPRAGDTAPAKDDAFASFGALGLPTALSGTTVRGTLGVIRDHGGEPAWVISSAAPLETADGTRHGAVAVATDVTPLRRAEDGLRLLADTSATLAGSLELQGTLPIVARQLVPRLADVCAIDLRDDSGVRRVAFACGETLDPAVHAMLERAPLLASGGAGTPQTLLVERAEAADLDALADGPTRQALGALDVRSFLRVPLCARGGCYGTLWLAVTQSERRYDARTRALADDIASRVAMAIDNARLYEESQRADHLKEEFLAMLSHELRTPLAPIMAWLQILQRAPDAGHTREAVEVIERNIRLQSGLIDDLLDLTAIARGKITLERTPIDLRQIVAAAVETIRPKMNERRIAFTHDTSGEPIVVDGDARRLQQLVWNLLANAAKFSAEHGRVELSLARNGDVAVVRIRDHGVGIESAFLPQVFDMFEQQDHGRRRRYGGLGIGLAIARRIAELHRGTITAASDGPGHGSEFCVRLPLRTAADRPGAVSSLEGRAVLLVEDVSDTRAAAHLMLEQAGIRVVEAAEGREALARLDEGAVDLVLCDLRMPLMDGFELIRRIRADPRHRRLPVVAVSGFAAHDDEERTRAAGFDAYVRKPFVEGTLMAALERVMQGSPSVRND
ncbi:MAG TPA: ATP-binding protein [Candidatus Binatia bacterium]